MSEPNVSAEEALRDVLARELVHVIEMESSGRVLNLGIEDRAQRWAIGLARKGAAALSSTEAGRLREALTSGIEKLWQERRWQSIEDAAAKYAVLAVIHAALESEAEHGA